MKNSEKPYLSVLDAFPGSGKTHLFRSVVFAAFTMGIDNHFVFLYVAPTKILCEEVHRDIRKQLKTYWLDYSPSRVEEYLSRADSRMHRVWRGAEPTTASASKRLNELLGTSGDLSKVAKPGSVIFTTHEAFSRVRNVPTASKTWVFFDEARQCLGVQHRIQLPLNLAPKILKRFSPVEVKLNINSEKSPERKVYKLRPPKTDLKLSLAEENPKVLHSILTLNRLLETTETGRSSVYILAPEAAVEESSSKKLLSTDRSISVFPFQNPKGLFQNYARVVILSAFFKDSQMCHSLADHYHIVDVLRPQEDSTYPNWIRTLISECTGKGRQSIKKRDRILRMNTGSKLKVVPLLVGSSDETESHSILETRLEEISSKDRLSKNCLTSGLIVTPDVQSQVIRYVEKNQLAMHSQDVIQSVWLHWHYLKPENVSLRKRIREFWGLRYKKDYKEHVPALYEILEPFMVDKGLPIFPAWTLTRQARSLSKLMGSKEKPLLVYNSSSRDMAYTPIPKKILEEVGLKKFHIVKDTQTLLREKFEKSFDIPDSPRLNGLNKWKESKHFVHLAALNPPLDTISLLKQVLPKYDAEYDFLLENLVQTLYRTSLRDVSSTVYDETPVFMYITKASVGRLLAQKIKLGFVDYTSKLEELNSRSLIDLQFFSEVKLDQWRKNRANAKTKYSLDVAKEVNSLRTRMRYYKTLLLTGKPLTEKQQQQHDLFQAKLKKLTISAKTQSQLKKEMTS